jgi:hypothetical protein
MQNKIYKKNQLNIECFLSLSKNKKEISNLSNINYNNINSISNRNTKEQINDDNDIKDIEDTINFNKLKFYPNDKKNFRKIWSPNKINKKQSKFLLKLIKKFIVVEIYLKEVEKIWPFEDHNFTEEEALEFLHINNNNTIETIKLIKIKDKIFLNFIESKINFNYLIYLYNIINTIKNPKIKKKFFMRMM